ncbi:MAG: hypothetical protein Q4D90_02625 [bacterium]|nr:hypothetical protein [bacterium]
MTTIVERREPLMDREVLVQYADMMEEIKDIRKRIETLNKEIRKLEQSQVSDTVKGSRGEYDIYGIIKITGIPDAVVTRKASALRRWQAMLELKEVELLELTCEAEEYIESIEKSELRIMFRLYYIDLLPWWKVAQQMNRIFPKRRKQYTEESCRKRNARFFEENV